MTFGTKMQLPSGHTEMLIHPKVSAYRGLPIATVDIMVPFHDIDAMEVVWHGNYLKYFGIARSMVLRAIDYDYPQMRQSGYVWPIVDMRSRFILPAKYGEQLGVAAIIVEWDLRLLVKYFVINQATKCVVARGQSIQVPLAIATYAMQLGCPDLLKEKIEAWQAANQSD